MPETLLTMITDDGGLRTVIPPTKVTWFNFLQLSRITNHEDGGWRNSEWETRGLKALMQAPKVLKVWTTNSIDGETEPIPRARDFKLTRPLSPKRANLLRPPFDPETCSENALNYHLFKKHKGLATGLRALGYEVPLCQTSIGQLKVDLLFANDRNRASLQILELKKGDNRTDSPLMAVLEGICYTIQLCRCRNELLTYLERHNIGEDYLRNLEIIIAAPNGYYKGWNVHENQVGQMVNIVGHVGTELKSAGMIDSLNLQFMRITNEGLEQWVFS